jgi:hypothetical protein
MTATATTVTHEEEEGLLQATLQRAAPDLFSTPNAIERVRRDPFKLSTSYDTSIVTVGMTDGSERKVFLKDFGFSARPKGARRERRERERRAYEELLPGTGIGCARYFGSVWDDARERHWLLLEFVDGTPVGYCDLSCWGPAAAGLGRMHGSFAGRVDELTACEFLIRHDADFFRAGAESALHGVGRVAPHLLARLRPLVWLYESLVPAMTDQPPTLLHGGCRSTNILIRIASDRSRVCILDWEEAGFGPPLLDVAYLLDGIEPPTLGPLLEAYRREATAYGLTLPPPGEMEYLVQAFRLHVVIHSLGECVLKRFTQRGIGKLLDLGERIGSALSSGESLARPQ